jgi:hypothetical protein
MKVSSSFEVKVSMDIQLVKNERRRIHDVEICMQESRQKKEASLTP